MVILCTNIILGYTRILYKYALELKKNFLKLEKKTSKNAEKNNKISKIKISSLKSQLHESNYVNMKTSSKITQKKKKMHFAPKSCP